MDLPRHVTTRSGRMYGTLEKTGFRQPKYSLFSSRWFWTAKGPSLCDIENARWVSSPLKPVRNWRQRRHHGKSPVHPVIWAHRAWRRQYARCRGAAGSKGAPQRQLRRSTRSVLNARRTSQKQVSPHPCGFVGIANGVLLIFRFLVVIFLFLCAGGGGCHCRQARPPLLN